MLLQKHPSREGSGWLRLRCYLLHGLEESLSVVLEGHDQLQLGASGFHGCGGRAKLLRREHARQRQRAGTAVFAT